MIIPIFTGCWRIFTSLTALPLSPAHQRSLRLWGECWFLLVLCANILSADPIHESNLIEPEDFTHLSLEQLGAIEVPRVYAASKHEQKITEAPSSVSIITRQDIREYGYRTLGEILNGIRGFYLTDDRAYQFLGIRGVNRLGDYGGRMLITINGHRINEPIYDSSFLGYDFPLDVDLIERIEVIRGAGSSLYGNNAFFGIINIITRTGGDFAGNGIETAVSHGKFDAQSGRFSYGLKLANSFNLLLSGTYYQSEGNDKLVFPASGATGFPGAVERHHDDQSAGDYFASIAYQAFTIEALYGRRYKDLPNGPYNAVFNDNRNTLWDERAYIEGRYEHDFAADWRLLVRTYFDHYTYAGTYIYDYMDPSYPPLVLNRDIPLAQWWGAETQMSKTFWEKHFVTLGVEGRHDLKIHQHNYDVDPAFTYIDETKSPYSYGIYAQDEFHIQTNLILNVGIRYDYFSTFGSTLNPRTGLIYQPWNASTFKALYGEAYRAPNAYEFDFDNIFYKGNHGLDPESIRSYEFVWEQGLAKNYRLTSTIFYNQIKDLIVQGVDPVDSRLVFNNTDSVDVRGGEIEWEGKWEHDFRVRISYAFADAVDNASGRTLNNSPRHVSKLQFTMPIYPDKIFAGIEFLTLSTRETANNNTLPGHVLTNLTLFSHKIARKFEVSASIYNLFDKSYFDAAAPDFAQELQPRDGRTFRLKLTGKF